VLCPNEDYSNWIAVRGIHTDQNCWPPHDIEDLTVYGVWVNDPMPSGLGQNWYITAEEFTTNYWQPINIPGVLRYNNYVCVADPPQDCNDSLFDDECVVSIGVLPGKLTKEQQILNNFQQSSSYAPELFEYVADQMAINAAMNAVNSVLILSGRSLEGTSAKVTLNQNSCIVSFRGPLDIDAYLDRIDLKLLKFSVL